MPLLFSNKLMQLAGIKRTISVGGDGIVDVGTKYDVYLIAKDLTAGPYTTSPLSQLNLSSCVPVTTQIIPLIHSEMLKLS